MHEYSIARVIQRRSLMEGVFAPSPSSWQGRRAFHRYHPVYCLGRESAPRCAVVSAVVNFDGVAAGVSPAPVNVLVLPDRSRFSAVRPVERDLRRALHSEVRVALVCDRQIFLQ